MILQSTKHQIQSTIFMVRKGGLEPPHLSVPDPKSGASANSATFALDLASLARSLQQKKEYHVLVSSVTGAREAGLVRFAFRVKLTHYARHRQESTHTMR